MKNSVRTRAHFVLEPSTSDDPSAPERLSRYYEELNGNRLLDENTTFAPIGKLHSWLRETMGKEKAEKGRGWSKEGEGS